MVCLCVAGLACLAQSIPALACSICIAVPEKTAADILGESRVVVLAREDPERPFSYAPVEVLKGRAPEHPIDLFVDSRTRRILSAYPERAVVLARGEDDGPWHNLGVAGPDYAAIVRRIVLMAPHWQGSQEGQPRVEFFVPLFGHENPRIYELAYLEMARAPYRVIGRLSQSVPRAQFEPMLTRRQYFKWRPLAILMLAHQADAEDRQYISDSFHTAERLGLTTNLAAWAAAFVEIEGAKAVAAIESRYLNSSRRTAAELTEVLRALSLHGSEGRTELRDRIVAAYGVLLEVHPDLAPLAVSDLVAWKRSELVEALARIESTHDGLDSAARENIRHYLRRAAAERGRAQQAD